MVPNLLEDLFILALGLDKGLFLPPFNLGIERAESLTSLLSLERARFTNLFFLHHRDISKDF